MFRRIEQMEETNGDLELVKGEFGQRLHDLERKLQNALREKELVKKQYLTAQEELHNRYVCFINAHRLLLLIA